MKKTFKKILAATLSAAMIFGGSVMTFADTVTTNAVDVTANDGEIEDLVNKQIYQVKLPTSTFVTNHFSSMKLDPQGLIWETSGDAFQNVSGPTVGFADLNTVTAGSILFRKEVALSGSTLTAVTYDTVSATLEAVNCGTVPITINAVTTVSGLAISGSSIALDADGQFSGTNATKAAVWLSVTGASTYSNDPTGPVTSAAAILSGATGANTGSATVVQAVSGAPATAYAVTTVAVAGQEKKNYLYAPVPALLTPVAADDDTQLSTDVSGKAIDTENKAFGRFTFVMTGLANKGADYQAWKDYKNISLDLDIVWEIEYDKNAEDRSNGDVYTFTAGQAFTISYEDGHARVTSIYNDTASFEVPAARYTAVNSNGNMTITFDSTWTSGNAATFANGGQLTVTYPNGDTTVLKIKSN